VRPAARIISPNLGFVASICAIAVFAVLLDLASSLKAQEVNGEAADPAASPAPMELRPPPMVSMTADPPYGLAPLTVGFLVVPTDPDNADFISYRWNFGNGSVGTLPPLMTNETYTNPGTYTVTMTATTADGRSVTAFTSVTVHAADFRNELSTQ
jgi:PKD repeat protein